MQETEKDHTGGQTSEADVLESKPVESIVTVEVPPLGEMLIPAPMAADPWAKIALKPRVDSFNEDELLNEMKALVDGGTDRLVLDLTQNRFISVRVIKACAETAGKLAEMDGSFVILACPEKTKRHFEVYGSTEHVRFVRNERDLQALKSRKRSSFV